MTHDEPDALDLIVDLAMYLYERPNYVLPRRYIWALSKILQEQIDKLTTK